MKIKCLLVDDEPLAIALLENHISKIASLEVVATCNNALKAFEVLSTQEIDLMFLDIKMPTISGVDFLKTLKNPPKTIFTTAYRDYALESYDLEVVDYLLKPIMFERFFKAIDKFIRVQEGIKNPEVTVKDDDFLLLKSGNKHHKVSLNDIFFIESLKDYIKVHIKNDKHIVAKYTLGAIEEELQDRRFLRIHRSFIINTSKISAFTINDIEVNAVEIPIGVSYKERALAFLDGIKKK
ncbi:MAG: DNA-binding response regulator [Flavobacteriaceae bacterium]|nr:MAG: DNA-binding response regulator [Flavobacteriaceae bacterium]